MAHKRHSLLDAQKPGQNQLCASFLWVRFRQFRFCCYGCGVWITSQESLVVVMTLVTEVVMMIGMEVVLIIGTGVGRIIVMGIVMVSVMEL